MNREITIRWIDWIDWCDLDKVNIYNILKEYDFHELDMEACMEENQSARIDVYEDYLFMILHFPKYNTKTRSYVINEFDIFLWKDFIVSIREHTWIHIDKLYERYSKFDLEDNQAIKISTGFILYEIIQVMLEKMFKVVNNIKSDIKLLEKNVFDNTSSSLVKGIMEKKRNILVLKNIFRPQVWVFKNIENAVNDFFNWNIEVYFEDLEDKLARLINDINLLEEHIWSIEDAFKNIIDIKTNSTIEILTIFSAFFLPLTLITSFYGMNISLPFQHNPIIVYIIFVLIMLFMYFAYYIFKKNWKL